MGEAGATCNPQLKAHDAWLGTLFKEHVHPGHPEHGSQTPESPSSKLQKLSAPHVDVVEQDGFC